MRWDPADVEVVVANLSTAFGRAIDAAGRLPDVDATRNCANDYIRSEVIIRRRIARAQGLPLGSVRKPAAAGRFYPANADELRAMVRGYVSAATLHGETPKAIIVPHAGYPYSGPIAGSGYAQIARLRRIVTRVVLLGPAHFVPVRGLAVPSVEAFATPLGQVPLDRDAIADLLLLPQVEVLDEAHAREHSLEVHLPFLQETLGEFKLVPLAVGEATADEAAQVVERLWGGPETLFVISSDLSHFHDYESAAELDRETSQLIESLQYEKLRGTRACGFKPISGILKVARERGMKVEILDVRSSGDTAGPRDRVVGYGAYAVR